MVEYLYSSSVVRIISFLLFYSMFMFKLNILDVKGQIAKKICFFFPTRYNNYDRSVINTIPHDIVQRWYVAHRELTTELRRPENELWVKLTPGKVRKLYLHVFSKSENQKTFFSRCQFQSNN